MFYTTDIYPPNNNNNIGAAIQNQSNNNNYNRSIHSDSYSSNSIVNNSNNNNKVNIVENRMVNTMMPNMYHHHQQQQQQQQQQYQGTKIDTNKRNRLKLLKPQNFRINLGSQGEQLYVKVGDLEHGQMQPQMHGGSYTWNPQNFNIYENHLHRESSSNARPETDTKTLNCD
jgi:hypothetical protein